MTNLETPSGSIPADFSLSNFLPILQKLRAEGKTLVTTNGCFDLMHAGHLDTLEAARTRGDFLIVLLNSDASVQRLKGAPRPYLSAQDRGRLLEALRCVDKVLVFDEDTPLNMMRALRPHVHVKGGSFLPERVKAEAELLASWGARLECFALREGVSSTTLIEQIWSTRPAELSPTPEHVISDANEAKSEQARAVQSPDVTALSNDWMQNTDAGGMQSTPRASRFPWLSLSALSTISIHDRQHLVTLEDLAVPPPPGNGIGALLDGFPLTRHRTNAAGSLNDVVNAIHDARARGASIIWACGPHVVKYGLSRLLIELMERKLVTALATNGAGAIHDCELALFGVTSEEMTGEIQTGRFGMARETGAFLNRAAREALHEGLGYGEALGRLLYTEQAPHRDISLLGNAYRLGIPMTVHVAMGTDIVHAQPSFSGQATGAATQHDFQILASCIDRLNGGGVHLNIASSVVLPEVFLKCLTVANNLRSVQQQGSVRDFLTVTMDHQSEYRPLMNVVRRPTVDVGRGLELLGRVEVMLPLLASLLLAKEPA